MGADLKTIAKAKGYQFALVKLYSGKPELDIGEKNIRLFYPKTEKIKAQKKFSESIKPKTETDIRIEYVPVVLPVLIKKYWVHATVTALLLMAIGKNV